MINLPRPWWKPLGLLRYDFSILSLVSSSLRHPVSRLVKDQAALTQVIDWPRFVQVLLMALSHSCDFWIDGFGRMSCTFVWFSQSLESVDDNQVWGSCQDLLELVVSLSFFLFPSYMCLLCCIEDNASFKYGGRDRIYYVISIRS